MLSCRCLCLLLAAAVAGCYLHLANPIRLSSAQISAAFEKRDDPPARQARSLQDKRASREPFVFIYNAKKRC